MNGQLMEVIYVELDGMLKKNTTRAASSAWSLGKAYKVLGVYPNHDSFLVANDENKFCLVELSAFLYVPDPEKVVEFVPKKTQTIDEVEDYSYGGARVVSKQGRIIEATKSEREKSGSSEYMNKSKEAKPAKEEKA